MSTVTEQLGLGEPQQPGGGSTEQADKFRADFQAEQGPINEALQYTAAHAEEAKHSPLAAKRDKTYSAYQIALSKIDPADPSVAQGAIDQVMTAIKALRSTVESLKDAVQTAYDAWVERQSDFDDVNEKIREMVDWGFEKATILQQVVEAISGKVNSRKWEEALQALEQLAEKLESIYEEFECQKEAQEQYETGRAALEPSLGEASVCTHASLAADEERIASLTSEMDAAVETKDFVVARDKMIELQTLVDKNLADEAQLDRKIIGSAQRERAEKKLEALSEADRERYNKIATDAKSPEELDYITKSLASGHSVDDIEAFAKKINGKNKDWLQNNLKLTGNTTGKGIKQQWGHSCNATTVQAVKGELDPIYALKLHEENKDVADADDSDGDKMNPKMAKEQKEMLESEYTGDFTGKHKGEAVKRDDVHTDGGGRFADDLLNDMSDSTGVEYKTKEIDTTYDFDAATADIESGISKGHPVPIVVGGAKTDTATSGEYTTSHYVMVTGSDPGPPPTWTIHDPWDGVTVTHKVEDFKDGKVNVGGGWKRLAAIENPSTKE